MAEIKIERKDKHAIWPWIIAAIVLLLLLWWWASSRHSNDSTAARTDSTMTMTSGGAVAATGAGAYGAGDSAGVNGATAGATGSAAGAPAAVTEFTNWVATVEPSRDEAKQHAYTIGGIRRLADALAAEGASGSALDNMRKQADALEQSSPNATNHADLTRSAFIAAADAFSTVAASHPNVAADTARIRSAATSMKGGTHLLDQKDKVQNFFDSARDGLKAISAG